jgi:hypothetical protein
MAQVPGAITQLRLVKSAGVARALPLPASGPDSSTHSQPSDSGWLGWFWPNAINLNAPISACTCQSHMRTRAKTRDMHACIHTYV